MKGLFQSKILMRLNIFITLKILTPNYLLIKCDFLYNKFKINCCVIKVWNCGARDKGIINMKNLLEVAGLSPKVCFGEHNISERLSWGMQ